MQDGAQWMPFTFFFANLPLESRFKHQNMLVISAVDSLTFETSLKIFTESLKEFNEKEKTHFFDQVGKKYLLRAVVQCFSCDNPRAMSLLNLAVGSPIRFCRFCFTKRKRYYRIKGARTLQHHKQILQQIREFPQQRTFLRTKFGIVDKHQLNLDELQYFQGFSEFPFDILHSIYLGLVKHCFEVTCKIKMDDSQRKLFLKYYRCLYTCGIEYLPRGNITMYVKSLVGKDFKAIAKVILACLQFLNLDEATLVAWKWICWIVHFVNQKSITKEALEDFDSKIVNAVRLIGGNFGGSIAKSVKLHLLLHLGQNIRRHGMPLGYSTEVFESFNKKMIKSTDYAKL